MAPAQIPALLFATFQIALWLLIVAAGVHLLSLGLRAFFRSIEAEGRPAPEILSPDALPLVTVQLPMCNERFVARRAIDAACALDWPAARLQIQVLDDSDPSDATCAIVDVAAAEWRARGSAVEVVRRTGRASFKAGNLDNALPLARGTFVAILDADAVPPRDFLRRLVPLLVADPRLGFAQGRSGFLNEAQNLLTRVQALILHGLFLVEQASLSARGQPVQFNGSGGVWRKAALVAAGGWVRKRADGSPEAASVAEDLDLSYRARLAGFAGRHVPALSIETELPASMAAFRAQQARWVRGGAQVLRGLFDELRARASGLGPRDVVTMLGHLARHARQPYLLLTALVLPIALVLESLGRLRPAFAPPLGLWGALSFLYAALFFYYGAALRRLGRSPLPALVLAPVIVALSVGLSACLSLAFVRGLLEDRRAAVFVRTPKTGGGPGTSTGAAAVRYAAPVDRVALLETALGLLHVAAGLFVYGLGQRLFALGLLGLSAPGLLWVGLGSLRAGGRRRA